MRHALTIGILAAVASVAVPATARAACELVVDQRACVTQAVGPVLSPSGLTTGTPLNVNETVRTGPGALVLLRLVWSDGTRTCRDDVMIDENGSYTLRKPAGSCAPRLYTESKVRTARTWSGEKGDDVSGRGMPPVPADVAASLREYEFLRQSIGGGMTAPRTGENRGGSDFDTVGLRTSSAAECSARCAGDARCKAMTYITTQNRCWLKSAAPAASPGNSDMVSAVKRPNVKALTP